MAGYLEGGWILDGQDAAGQTLTIRLTDRELTAAEHGVTLGRHPALVDHVIDEPSVSRRHLRVGFSEGGLTVEDLNSLNGTLVDGTDLPAYKAAVIEGGRRLTLGRVELRLVRIAA
ncbi:MAG: FHA domain-containing protein [Pseudomonadota bacterium]